MDDNFKLFMGKSLIKWYTAKLIDDKCDNYEFILSNSYKHVNIDIYNLCQTIENYRKTNFVKLEGSNNYKTLSERSAEALIYDEMTTMMDKIIKLQVYVNDNPNDNDIKQKSWELFNADIIKDAEAIDMEIYLKFQRLLEYCEPIHPLMNMIDFKEDAVDQWLPIINELLKVKNLFNFELNFKENVENELLIS
jgi:hypothetical protein